MDELKLHPKTNPITLQRMHLRRAAQIVVFPVAILMGAGSGVAQSVAYRAPQYQAIRTRLAHGWGTWNSANILEQVHLPDGSAVGLAFKQTTWIGSEYLNSALIGRSGPADEKVRPGLHAMDGSYSEYELKWRTLDAKISSASVGKDGDDLVLLVEPLHASSLPIEMIAKAAVLWNRPGAATLQGNTLELRTTGHDFRVYTTGQRVRDPYAGAESPYIAVRLDGPVGISIGRPRSLAEIQSLLKAKRAALTTRAAALGKRAETYEAIEAVLGWNTIYEPRYERVITTVGRLWNEEYGGYGLFGWDNFFLAYMTSLYSRDLALADFIEHLRSMTDAGFIPNDDRGNGTKSWDHSQPPVGSLMLKEIYKRYPEKWLLEASFPDLLRWNEWWFHARMNEGLLSYGSNLAQNPYDAPDTHSKVTAGYESGMDDSPMYTGVPFNPTKNTLELQDVGLNSLYVADCRALEEIAALLGREADAAQIAQRRKAIEQHMPALWSAAMELYLNRATDTGELSHVLSPTMFYPLLAGIVDQRTAKEMVERHLLNDREFGGEYVIPSVARDDPDFAKQRYWKGAVWPPLNFLAYLGLRDYGLFTASRELADKSNAMFLREWQEKGIICENYSAITGTGDDPRLSSDRFHSWGALMGFLSLIEDGRMPATEAPLSRQDGAAQ